MHTQQSPKRSFSASGDGDCIEVMALLDGQVGLRDSKHPEAGEFDDLC